MEQYLRIERQSFSIREIMMIKIAKRWVIVMLGFLPPLLAHAASIGQFSENGDVGSVKRSGTVHYDAELQHYRISGAGTNMWSTRDELHYAYTELTGDFILRAHVAFEGKGVDPHRKMGWNLRTSLDTDSPNVHAAVHGDGLRSLMFRARDGGEAEQ